MSTTQHDDQHPKRMTVSRMAELLASKTHTARPSVTISRNAKGEAQFEVVCPADTIEDAERQATEVYERLVARFPYSLEATVASGRVHRTPSASGSGRGRSDT